MAHELAIIGNGSPTDCPEGEAAFLLEAKIEISRLHREVVASARITADKGFQIGQRLYGIKAKLKHGKWVNWVSVHLPFDIRTAQNYMLIYRQREPLMEKYATISHLGLTDVYRLVAGFTKKVKMIESHNGGSHASTKEAQPIEATIIQQPSGEVKQLEHHSENFGDVGEELIVGAFTPQQAQQVLQFIRGLGITHDDVQVLRGHGEIAKLKLKLQDKLAPYVNKTGMLEASL